MNALKMGNACSIQIAPEVRRANDSRYDHAAQASLLYPAHQGTPMTMLLCVPAGEALGLCGTVCCAIFA